MLRPFNSGSNLPPPRPVQGLREGESGNAILTYFNSGQ